MEIITSVEIRKFRSIKSLVGKNLRPRDLNVFVGLNDQGKSNVLRALNLFFNEQTEVGQPFRFEDDYCFHAATGTGTRREIRIDLEINPPKERFKHARPVKWTKRWRRDGSVTEKRVYLDTGEEVSSKNNVSKWMDKLRYRYVPAIKGRNYFTNLMGELHDVLNEAHSETLRDQGEQFISGIQRITDSITSELVVQLGLRNTIQVPSDFRVLFSNLDFGSKQDDKTYHLKQRGDGVKVRHIPIILKYMADQERSVSIPGFVKPDTIWGFEEPENNLELGTAYELAAKFRDYSKDIQIFVTTHSPAFYALDVTDHDGVNSYFVSQDEDLCTTVSKISHDGTDELHEKMGLLPLITPYLTQINESKRQVEKLKDQIDGLSQQIDCCVLTEDEDNDHVATYFSNSGFRRDRTEFVSYYGADQYRSCIILARHLKDKRPNLEIIIHRDRDYLTDEEVEESRSKFAKFGFKLFVTSGVDIESQFLDPSHINELYPTISIEEAKAFIEEATEEAEEKSMDRLLNQSLKINPTKGDYAGKIKELQELYQNDKVRYRYGKKVAGLLQSKLQHHTGNNVQLYRESAHIVDPALAKIASKIWEEDN